MADVFISYKRRLRPVVERIAQALRSRGLTVWFDARLEPGDSFSDEIAREVRQAKCVVVCWSNDAFPHGGDAQAWVRGEATIGRERGVLVSVQVEPTEFDPPWNMMHHEDLVGWAEADRPGNEGDRRWLSVLEAIGRKVGRRDLAAAPEQAPLPAAGSAREAVRRSFSFRSRTGALIGLVVLLTAFAAAGALFMLKPSGPAESPFKTTMLQYCAQTPATVTYDCACMAGVLERELNETDRAIFLIVGKPGATSDPQAADRLLRDAGYSDAEIASANAAVPRAVAKVAQECVKAGSQSRP